MERKKYYCLYCGHLLEEKVGIPQERRCSRCHTKRWLVEEEVYQRGIRQAKRLLKANLPDVTPLQAMSDVLAVLSNTFPNPFIPAKTLVDVIQKAQKEIEEEA